MDYSPVWRFVARYMYWAPPLQSLADQYVRRTIGISDSDPIPSVSMNQFGVRDMLA